METSFALLIPKSSDFLHLQYVSHFSSPFQWTKPTDLRSSKPTPPFLKPFSINRKTSFDKKVTSTKGELDWVSDKINPKGISKSSTTQENYTLILRQCIESKRLDEARDLYFKMKDQGLEPGIFLETILVDQLLKSRHVSNAFQVFEKMTKRNVVTWTSIISGCVQNDRQEIGLSLFVEMLESDIVPNDFTFNVAIQACADLEEINVGKQVHSLVIKSGLNGDCRIANCLIDFYSKCCLVDNANKIFDRMLKPDLVSFTTMIAGFSMNNLFESAVRVFEQMRRLGLDPNEYTISSVLASCGCLLCEQIHGYMIKTLLDQSFYCASALIECYSKNNCVRRAMLVFENLDCRNVVIWSTMISCCTRNGLVNEGLELFCEMVYSGVEPNEFTYATAIGACGLCSESFSLGQQLQCSVIKLNLGSIDRIFNALLTMYARNGKVEELATVFEKIQDPDIVSWCATISGYSQNGFNEKSASLLCLMHRKGINPNEFGFSSALSSCANVALLDQGRQFHGLALKLAFDFDVCVGNALVNMYAKCGSIEDAWLAFDMMPIHDVMSWNTLIHGYAHHGHGRKALQVFDEMVESAGIVANHATFVGVLNACSHVGYIEEAFGYFKVMESHYRVEPSILHYACMIDMMGRAGRLDDAVQIIEQMPFEPDSLIWKTLSGCCIVHKNLEIGKFAAERAIELSPKDSANYVLLSNLHATCGEWEDANRLRKTMEERGLKKVAGWSWIEINSEVHAFIARDRSHPRAKAIYEKLEELVKEMKEEGYFPDLSFGLYDS
ncbi:putative pentatricopeptide repeat-containing protein At3g01580 [Tasmannia lanceolata]|uniref:putative pentatricopeptide repeat-containing protein At3g01580 n=1 Tax=Tasmannia lanceolata TaxID=3420 RepID=UPI004063F89E